MGGTTSAHAMRYFSISWQNLHGIVAWHDRDGHTDKKTLVHTGVRPVRASSAPCIPVGPHETRTHAVGERKDGGHDTIARRPVGEDRINVKITVLTL